MKKCQTVVKVKIKDVREEKVALPIQFTLQQVHFSSVKRKNVEVKREIKEK